MSKLTLTEPLEDHEFTDEEAAWYVDADMATRRAVARSCRREVAAGVAFVLLLAALFAGVVWQIVVERLTEVRW